MNLASMTHDEVEKALKQALTFEDERQKLTPLQKKRDAYLAPHFEQTSDGIFAKNEKAAALNDPKIHKLQQQLDEAQDRLALAKNPVPIKRSKDRQTIIIAAVFFIIAIIAFIARQVLHLQVDTTPQRVLTMIYTVSAVFGVAYIIYRYFFWKKYAVALVKFAQGKLDELAPVQKELNQQLAAIDTQYAQHMEPFSQTFTTEDPAYDQVQAPFLAQLKQTDQAREALEAIPTDLRDKHIIQRFIQNLHRDPAATWRSVSDAYRSELQQQQQAKQAAQQLAAQKKRDAQNNTARNRNRRSQQQQHHQQ